MAQRHFIEKETLKRTLWSVILLSIITIVITQDAGLTTYFPGAGANGEIARRVVVPRFAGQENYPLFDAHYSGNFYVASGPDYISWGREHFVGTNQEPLRSFRRTWIEAIQDHECFAEADTTGNPGRDGSANNWGQKRNVCIACGIGGCERIDLSANTGNGHGTATNVTVYRHNLYWDWLGRTANGGAANTYRTEAVSTVAVIDRTDYFLCGGAAARGVTRWDYKSNNTYWQQGGFLGGANITTDVVDLFIVRPSPFYVITRSNTNYQVGSYVNMNAISTFGGGLAGANRGGFGDYIDWKPSELNVCISRDFLPEVNCYRLAAIAAAYVTFNIDLPAAAAPDVHIVRALAGIDESPFFGVATRDKIRVYNIWTASTQNVQLDFTETAGGRHANPMFNQIYDLVYINTHGYRAGGAPLGYNKNTNPFGWDSYNRRWNIRAGPHRNVDNINNKNIGIPWTTTLAPGAVGAPGYAGAVGAVASNPRERFFYVTRDRGKIVWFRGAGAVNSCHPFCAGACHYGFSRRWCSGNTCAQRGAVGAANNEYFIYGSGQPFAAAPNLYTGCRVDPPECRPCDYPTDDIAATAAVPWEPQGGNRVASYPIVFTNNNNQATIRPNTAVPYKNAPPLQDTVTAVIAGQTPPPFAPVPAVAAPVAVPTTNVDTRKTGSSWWKWLLLALLLLFLLLLMLCAICCGDKTLTRRPVAREVVEVEEKIIAPKVHKQEYIEEKFYETTPRKTIVEKTIVEQKPIVQIAEKVIVQEKLSFNPYKQKSVAFKL